MDGASQLVLYTMEPLPTRDRVPQQLLPLLADAVAIEDEVLNLQHLVSVLYLVL